MRWTFVLMACLTWCMTHASVVQGSEVSSELWSVTESRFRAFADDQNHNFAEKKLTLTLVLRGPAVKSATHWGYVLLDEATDSGGRELKLQAGYKNAPESWVQINREHMWFFSDNAPDDAIKVELEMEPTNRGADQIKSLQGRVQLKNGELKEVLVADLAGLQGASVDDPALTAAGVQVNVVHVQPENQSETVKLQVTGPADAIQEMSLVDTANQRIDNGKMWYQMGDTTTYSLGVQDKLDPTTRLKIMVETSKQVTDVPFSFEGILLP